jgi:hypothetical protein
MDRFFKLNKNLFLVEKELPQLTKTVEPEPTNHIWIYDRSYSMSYELPQLTQDIIKKAKEIPVGDTVTLGWFSGEGDYNFILKGFQVGREKDYTVLEKAVLKNNSPVSCTCFSEILADTENVIEDLSVISDRFSLLFFTDGYPVVRNYSREIESIFQAIEKVEGKVTSSCLVGYSNYYNRDLMVDMAERLGGSLIHNDSLTDFNITLSDLIQNASDSESKVRVEFDGAQPNQGVIFSVAGNNLNVYKQKEDGSIGFVPNKESKSDYVYFLTDRLSGSEKEVKLGKADVLRPSTKSSMLGAVYGVACLLNQKAKTDVAMEAVSSIGDKHFVDLLTNAYTNSEHGTAENALKEAMSDTKKRLTEGYDTAYLPPADAFCLLDMLEILMQDDEAHFYPYHPNFKYKRIGQKTKVIGKYPTFKPQDNVKCKLSDLSWNKTMLNLSVRATINGTINLKKGYKELGLNRTYPTHIHRNYSLVKDGLLNMKTLPVSMSKTTFNKLKAEGLFSGYTYEADHIYDLPLSAVPIMNRAIAEGRTSATALASKVQKQLQLEATMKVLNGLKKDLEATSGASADTFAGLSDSQVEFLEENGITKNGFSPKTEKEDPVDFYYAKEFKIAVKGVSSFPKVADVQKKVASGKDLTPREELIQNGIELYETSPVVKSSDKVKLAWLEDTVKAVKAELLTTRFDVQKTKFAILLGKKWFDEFESRENCSLEVNGKSVSFDVTEKRVNI